MVTGISSLITYEQQCENLPSVPDDENLDEELDSQLLRFKFFNKIWLKDEKVEEVTIEDKTDSKTDTDKTIDEKIENKVDVKEETAVNDTMAEEGLQTVHEHMQEERKMDTENPDENVESFNDWYEAQLQVKKRKYGKYQRIEEISNNDIYSMDYNKSVDSDEDPRKEFFDLHDEIENNDFVHVSHKLVPNTFIQAYFVLLLVMMTHAELCSQTRHSCYDAVVGNVTAKCVAKMMMYLVIAWCRKLGERVQCRFKNLKKKVMSYIGRTI